MRKLSQHTNSGQKSVVNGRSVERSEEANVNIDQTDITEVASVSYISRYLVSSPAEKAKIRSIVREAKITTIVRRALLDRPYIPGPLTVS